MILPGCIKILLGNQDFLRLPMTSWDRPGPPRTSEEAGKTGESLAVLGEWASRLSSLQVHLQGLDVPLESLQEIVQS